MLNAIIRFSLRYRMLVVALSLTVMVYGSYLATTLPNSWPIPSSAAIPLLTLYLFVLAGGRLIRLRVERRATDQWGEEWERAAARWGRRTG